MSHILDPVTQHHIRQASDALADEFAGVFSEETIERDGVARPPRPEQDQRVRSRAGAPLRA
jgi:hypothetical protein